MTTEEIKSVVRALNNYRQINSNWFHDIDRTAERLKDFIGQPDLAITLSSVEQSPWRPVKEMPADKWFYCRNKSNPDALPYLARIESASGECFDIEDDLVFPDYFMPIPKLPED